MSQFPHLSMLDCLRPAPGWRTDCAVISTYSAHMSVLAAALLALAGEVDESGSGSRIGLVRALTGLRGKVHFVLQAGRLTQSRKSTAIAALLDQFLVQVPWNEAAGAVGKSWHAKFMLVRQVPIDSNLPGERWSFMLGSRNLTLDTSWDIGLSLKAGEGCEVERSGTLQTVEGIARLASDLARMFPPLARWSSFTSGLQEARWRVGEGMAITGLRLLLPDDAKRGMPQSPAELKRVVAVSPFLDKGALAELNKWRLRGSELRRQLLSTRSALAAVYGMGVKSDAPFELLALAEPELGLVTSPSLSAEEALEPDSIGLHAKMIYAEHAAGSTLWLGSPNLTQRAWNRNAECVVRVDATGSEGEIALRAGIEALIERANTVDVETLRGLAGEKTIEQRLADARNEVAAAMASARQQRDAGGQVLIECTESPHPVDPEIDLFCGQMMAIDTQWPRSKKLHVFFGSPGIESDCVCFRLLLEDTSVEWVQVVPFDPALDLEQRDGQVLGDYLGSKQMLSWIHSVLSGYSDGDEGGLWDAQRTPHLGRGRTQAAQIELPSLEQALRMWLKDRPRLDEVDRILDLRRQQSGALIDPEMEQRLDDFSSSWKIIRSSLPRSSR